MDRDAAIATFMAGLASCLSGCASGGGGADVVVGLTTDMAVGFDLRRLETTTRVGGADPETESLSYGSGDLKLPAERVIEAPDGAGVEVTFTAFGKGEATSPAVTRTVRTRAVGGRGPIGYSHR